MTLVYKWLIFMIVFIQYFSAEGFTFSVSTYGAYADDDIDDTKCHHHFL
jgi:hypothetical protein